MIVDTRSVGLLSRVAHQGRSHTYLAKWAIGPTLRGECQGQDGPKEVDWAKACFPVVDDQLKLPDRRREEVIHSRPAQ